LKGLGVLEKRGFVNRHPQRGYFVADRDRPQSAIGQIALITQALSGDTSPYAKGISDAIDHEEFTLSIFSAHADLGKYQRTIEQVARFKPAGVILTLMPEEICRINPAPLLEAEIPLVALGPYVPDLACDRVIHTGWDSGKRVARYLLRCQTSNPAILMVAPRKEHADMVAGIRKGLEPAGIELPEERIFVIDAPHGHDPVPDPYIDAEEQMARLLREGLTCDSLICCHDYPAVGALRAILSAKIDVPNEMKVISSCRCAVEGVSPMKLTTVDSHHEEQGRLAAELLRRRIDGHDGPPEVHYVTGELIEGETT